MENFDELNPRTAPAPKCFSAAPFSSAVPEVSLVFSPSARQPIKQALLSNFNDNDQSSLFNNGSVSAKRIYGSAYKNLDRKELGGVCEKNVKMIVKNDSLAGQSPSPKLPKEYHCANDRLMGNCSTALRKAPQSPLPGPDINKRNAMTYLYETNQVDPSAQHRKMIPQETNPRYLQETKSHAVDTKTSDVHICNQMKLDNQISAHCTGNEMHVNQILERSLGCLQNRSAPVAIPLANLYVRGKQQCCTNHNHCVLAQDMSLDRYNTVSRAAVPTNSINIPYHSSHVEVDKNGACCIPHMSCVNTHEKVKDRNVCDGLHSHSRTPVNVHPEVISQFNDYNKHVCEKNKDLCGRKNYQDEKIISKNVSTRLNDCTAHTVKEHSYMNTKHCKEVNKTCVHHNPELDDCAEIQKQDTECKKNSVSPLKPSQENKERQSVGKSSDTSILQEIALMNHKQCSILQGLLQQVVAMQADQMKILGEINEKLSNAQISENKVLSTCKDHCIAPSVVPKLANATTQTNVNVNLDNCCQKCEDQNENVTVPHAECSLKYSPTIPVSTKNVQPNDIVSPSQRETEKDQEEVRKLQDRAVSWSAVHGVETIEESFTLHGVCVPTVVDQLPSSVHTMHLHVQDYHSSASFDSVVENRHVNKSHCSEDGQDNHKGSWTLYDNIVGHVKKFLQTVPCEKSGSTTQKTSQVEAIRFATIEKIRQLGVSVYENSAEIKEYNATGMVNFDSKIASRTSHHDVNPITEKGNSDASMELQALALKYLQDDDLCDFVKCNQDSKTPSILKNGQKSANISLATQHYLEKYHLLPPGIDNKDKRHINAHCGHICVEDNILDITTLKRQPKLL